MSEPSGNMRVGVWPPTFSISREERWVRVDLGDGTFRYQSIATSEQVSIPLPPTPPDGIA